MTARWTSLIGLALLGGGLAGLAATDPAVAVATLAVVAAAALFLGARHEPITQRLPAASPVRPHAAVPRTHAQPGGVTLGEPRSPRAP